MITPNYRIDEKTIRFNDLDEPTTIFLVVRSINGEHVEYDRIVHVTPHDVVARKVQSLLQPLSKRFTTVVNLSKAEDIVLEPIIERGY